MNLPAPINQEPIPGYRLISRIGRGGYGEVWRVEAPGGIHKAIKFVFGDLEGIGRESTGAEQEYKSLHRVKSIRHPFILSIERFDVVDGQLLIVMELADSNLWDRYGECQRQGMVGIPRKELLGYMSEAAEALDLMNQQYNIQHLDIKPQNLFLLHNHVKVADFGLAKDLEGLRATVTGGMTPVYAPPETFEGWVSRNSDQYSLAIVYQELLTGIRPFTGSKPRELLLQHLQAEPNVSALPPADQAIIRKALAKSPEQRFSSCKEMVEALIENQGTARTIVPPQVPDPMVLTPRPILTPHRESIPTPLPSEKPKGRSISVPALVTPKSKDQLNQPAPLTLQRHEVVQTQRMSRLGFAPPEQNGGGVLYPALYIGIGRFGLMTLKRMREQLYERFGRTSFPHWRWLFIDTDTETIQDALRGHPHIAFSAAETLHLRLHRPTHYQHNNGGLYEKWLPNELLFRIPREPSTLGLRCLGRLAFFSNIGAVVQRLRSEIENFLREDLMMEAETITGLTMRTNRPRTHLIASLSGGTGSGMLIDLAYLIKMELQQVGYLSPKIFANLGGSPTANGPAQANAVATIKEIEYFSRVQTTYQETFENGSAPYIDKEGPFLKCLIVPHSTRIPNTEILAQVIVADATTSCGKVVENSGRWSQANRGVQVQFTTANIRRVVWPRNSLLQSTTKQLACQVIDSWSGPLSSDNAQILNQEFSDWCLTRLEPSIISTRLENHGQKELGEIPSLFFKNLISSLDPQKLDPHTCNQLLERLHSLLGNPLSTDPNERSELEKALNQCVEILIQEIDGAILSKTVNLIERPGLRLSGADLFLRNLEGYLRFQFENLDRWVQSLQPQANLAYSELLEALLVAGLHKEAKSKAPNRRTEEASQNVIAKFLGWATARYRFLAADSARSLYNALLRRTPEYTREISFCRVQAEDYRRKFITESTPTESPLDHPVLPAGSSTLHTAAEAIAQEIPPSELAMLDGLLQEQVKKEFRACVQVFLKPNEYGHLFTALLQQICRDYLDSKLEKANALQAIIDFLPEGLARDQFLKKVFDRSKISYKGTAELPTICVVGLPEAEGRSSLQARLSQLLESEQPLFAQADQELIFWNEGLYSPPNVVEKIENHPSFSRFDLNIS